VHLDSAGVTVFTISPFRPFQPSRGGTAVRLGRAAGAELDARLTRFDVIWGAALAEDERREIRTIHLDSPTRPDRVTVRLAETRRAPEPQ
jgi:hypothetical protein